MRSGLVYRCLVPLGLASLLALPLAAEDKPALPELSVVTAEQHNDHMATLSVLVTDCVADAKGCDAQLVGPDERMQLANGTTARLRLEWLREGLRTMAVDPTDERTKQGALLKERLARISKRADAIAPAQLAQGRAEVDRVLATKEFLKQPEPTWVERQWRAFVDWLDRVFGKSFDAVTEAPRWLKYFFQALLFLVPAVLLLLWFMRQVREDRIRPAKLNELVERGPLAPPNEWLKQAEEFARAGDWRQAIHALYWATIAGFEERRVWRSNRTRTPREYLRLLAPGSAARVALMEQTRLFELTWYGYRDASTTDYARAVELQSRMEAE